MKKPTQKGHIIVLSGPSGAGKSTVISALKRERPNLAFSVSHTTRKPREGEVDGIHYHFISKEAFEEMIRSDRFLEYTCYQGNYYGTSTQEVERLSAMGKDVLLDIEVEGAGNVRSKCPGVIEIFMTPPSFEELSRRLHNRHTESDEVINSRLERAKEEFQHISSFDYLVINDKVENAAREILAILHAADCRVSNRSGMIEKLNLL